MDENRLPWSKIRFVDQCHVCSGVHNRQHGGLLEAHGVGHLNADRPSHREVRREAAAPHVQDTVTDRQVLNAWPDRAHNAAALEPHLLGVVLEGAEGNHQIPEVQTHSLDLHEHLALGGSPRLLFAPVHRGSRPGVLTSRRFRTVATWT